MHQFLQLNKVNLSVTLAIILTFIWTIRFTKIKLSSLFTDLLKEINSLPINSKNKLLLYSRFVLCKVSWHFAVADLSKTWVTENFDNLVSKYICQWLELPISATLSSIILSKNQLYLNMILPSIKFSQMPNCFSQFSLILS